MKRRNQPLDVNIEQQQLVIRIGIDTLAFAFEESNENHKYDEKKHDWNKLVKVLDSEQFAKDVMYELTREEEDGSSNLTNLLDIACVEALNQGSIAVEYKEEK